MAHRFGPARRLAALVLLVLGGALAPSGLAAAGSADRPLPVDRPLFSPDGLVELVLQPDGNLVAYGGGAALWNSGTYGHRDNAATLQSDGNLVVRSVTGAALWASGTRGSGATGLRVADTGAVQLVDAGGRVRWDSGSRLSALDKPMTLVAGQSLTATTGERLILQTDGNLVAYRGTRAYWNTGTYGHPGATVTLGGDGNLVLRAANGRALWVSGTRGPTPNRLVLAPGGTLSLRNPANRIVWTSAPAAHIPAVPHYVFPVVPAGGVDYAHVHHDYPATDVFTACGSDVVAVTAGVLQEVRTVDTWDPATNDPAVRGGLTVSLIGDDGVRYYEAHFSDLLATTRPGERVVAGTLLGHAGESGDARGLGCHVHFGMSPPCGPGDWSIRRGVFYPWPYLDSWRVGGQLSPVAAMTAWRAAHAGECARGRLDDPIPDP